MRLTSSFRRSGRHISRNDTSYQIAPVQVLKLREARRHFLLSSHHERPVSLLSGARPFLVGSVRSSCYYHRPKLVDVFAQSRWSSVHTLSERNVRRRHNNDLRWCRRVFPAIPRPFCAEVAGLEDPVLIRYERGCVESLRLQHLRGGHQRVVFLPDQVLGPVQAGGGVASVCSRAGGGVADRQRIAAAEGAFRVGFDCFGRWLGNVGAHCGRLLARGLDLLRFWNKAELDEEISRMKHPEEDIYCRDPASDNGIDAVTGTMAQTYKERERQRASGSL